VVVGFACTAGSDDDNTYLYLNPLRIVCGVAPNEQVFQLQPDGEGNAGPIPPVAWQTAIYSGQEEFEDFDKCYWNLALGLDVAALQALAPCRVELTGTASGTPFEGGVSPDAVFPVITWSVPLDLDGGPLCDPQALNGEGSGVQTGYTDFEGEPFAYELDCDDGGIETPGGYDCVGAPGLTSVSVAMVGAGQLVATVGQTSSPTYTLPSQYRLAPSTAQEPGCCVDPCCNE
jgi:hypothetical protein